MHYLGDAYLIVCPCLTPIATCAEEQCISIQWGASRPSFGEMVFPHVRDIQCAETLALSCGLYILPNLSLNSNPWQIRPLAPSSILCSASIMISQGSLLVLAVEPLWFHFLRCSLLGCPDTYLFCTFLVQVFSLHSEWCYYFSPSWWEKKKNTKCKYTKNVPKSNSCI